MSEREGQRVGNYHLHRLLGKGAFAEVYLGEHLYLGSSAAIKILHISLNEENEQLFLSEARTVAQLTHPNIVRVREFAIERSIPYLVMDYAPGGTLRHRYPKGTCLSLEKTVSYVKQIATALQYAHNRGIIHRDVKPENVLQGAEQVMLSDFGISIHSPEPNTVNSQKWSGTLPYMASEQFRGNAVFASDQYALAVLAYEWLCGVRPFEGSPLSLAYQHTSVVPPRLRERDPSLPEAVEVVVLKALAKKPEDRYVSIINFARALERASRDSSSEIEADGATELPNAPRLTRSRRVFLSHAPLDDTTRLQADLEVRDISVQDDSAAGFQEERTRQAIRAAQVVFLLLTPHTRSAVAVKEHLRIAELYRRRIICVWGQGDDLRELLPVGTEQATIIDARGQRYKEALNEMIAYLEQEYRGTVNSETGFPEHVLPPRNPYKGLLAFTQKDRADFFGRTSVVQELLTLLKKMVSSAPGEGPTPRFLAVVGPSGSGKSSVVMAGLLPKLQDGALPGSEEWVYLDPVVPGKQPLEELVGRLATHFSAKDPQAIREMLREEGGSGLHQFARTLVRQPETRLVLMVDQFEELFSPGLPEQERLDFIDLLVTAATEPGGPVVVLMTLRADFYDRPLAYPTLARLIQQQQCLVLPMSVEELREVIERPALLSDVRLIFEEDLVSDLLFDMREQAGALPLLEFTLDQLFHHRRERRLTRRAYQEIGGVRGALSKQAESAYEALPSEEHRRLARTLFMRLIQSGAVGQEPLRRRAALSEFDLAEVSEKQRMRETLEAFIQARLLTTSQSRGITTIEVSHEAVMREWKRLTEWLHEASADVRLQQSLSADVTEWNQRKRPQARLYRGTQLKEARDWAKRNKPSEQETAFLRMSAMRHTRSFMSLIVVVLLLVSSTGVAGWYIFLQPQPTLVTNLQDNGVGSLRWCVQNAPTGSTITFASGVRGIIKLTGDLTFEGGRQLTLAGPGARQLGISGGDLRVFIHVSKTATLTVSGLSFKDTHTVQSFMYNEGTVTLTDSIFSNNKNTTGNRAFGGGIHNPGTLTVRRSIFEKNTATGTDGSTGLGGGILNTGSGTLLVEDSIFSENSASGEGNGQGGAIQNDGKLTVKRSTFERNTATGSSDSAGAGGGILNFESGTLVVEASRFLENSASGDRNGQGGAIQNDGKLTVKRSTFERNTATGSNGSAGLGGSISSGRNSNNSIGSAVVEASVFSENSANGEGNGEGGAIYNYSKLTMTNSTLSNNTASGTSQNGQGGGISNDGNLTVIYSTLYGNRAMSTNGASVGGGIFNNRKGRDVTLGMSVVAANKAQQGPDIARSLTSGGYNLMLDKTGVDGLSTTDRQVTLFDLKLDPILRDNGGPTQTLALLPRSLAVDAVPLEVCHITITDAFGDPVTITTDQRGDPRPDGKGRMCDVGAYELR